MSRLADTVDGWAFAALTASPGARRCYDAHRARGATHHQALRALGNRLVGVVHGCLAHRPTRSLTSGAGVPGVQPPRRYWQPGSPGERW
jgi:hypothetical protein